MRRHNILHALAAVLTGALLAACGTPLHSTQTIAMTETATKTPTQADATTYCLGRFLIDVPAGRKLSGGNYKYNFAQIEKPVAMSLEQFNQELKAREKKLRSIKHEKEPGLLRTTQRPDKTSQVLAFWPEEYSEFGVEIEGYKWVNGIRFHLKSEADPDRQTKAVARMVDRLSRLRPRVDTDIPAEPGYCFAGGFIANTEWENEQALATIDIAGQPDAFISVWILPLAAHKRDKPLLDRMGGALQQLGTFASGVHVLRKGERQIASFKGQEYLAAGPNSGGMRGHLFTWETQGDGTLDTPFIEIRLETGHQDNKGNPQQTKLSNEQALQLWDRIVSSFRLRPVGGAPAKTSEATPPQAPLGELAATGRTCPQTGWWQCSEGGEVVGGKRQHFTAGQRMPHAVLWGEPSIWQKFKNERPRHKTATVWQLVDYDAVPVAKADTATPPQTNAAQDTLPPSEG